MASRIRQARRRAQPRLKTAIDWSNPITRGLTFAALPVGGVMFDAVSGARGTPSGSTPPVLTNTTGQRGMLHAGGAASVSYSDFGALPRPSDLGLNGGTFFAWGVNGGAGGIIERNDGNTVNAGWSAGIDSSGFLQFLAEHSSVNYIKRTSNAVGTGVTSVAVTCLPNPMVDADTAFYIGGQPAATVLQAGGSGSTGSDLSNSLLVGRAGFNSSGTTFAGSFNGTLELVLLWNRQLSAAEIASLHANRYQIFRQTSRRIITYLPPSNTNVAITGNAATGSPGTVGVTHTSATTGNGATAAAGSVLATSALATTGNAATGSPGAVGVTHTSASTGTSSAASTGTLAASTTTTLSGNTSAANVGQLVPGLTVATAGVAATGATGAVVTADTNITVGLTGNTATAVVGLIYFGVPPVLAEQTPTFIITSANTVDVSSAINNVETSVSL